MTEFSITPEERAGIEKAAQWHEGMRTMVLLAMRQPGLVKPVREELQYLADAQLRYAAGLRALLEPRSSAQMQAQDPAADESRILGGGSGGQYSPGTETK